MTFEVRTTCSYIATYPDPIRGKAGDEVLCGRNDPDNPVWTWCVGPEGREGWVHQDFLLRNPGTDKATLSEDYDAVELTVAANEVLTVLREATGWYFCKTSTGKIGWISIDTAEPIPGN